MKHQLQFEVWQSCNSKCDFCYLKSSNVRDDDDLKIVRLKQIISTLSDGNTYNHYDVVSLIGGEFFQGQVNNAIVNRLWYRLIELLNEKLNSGQLRQVWIMASLLIGKQPDLYKTVEKFDDKSKLWINTSWDSHGRFKGKMKQTWETHMENLYQLDHDIHMNTTCILTQDWIEHYLNNKFNIEWFSKQFHTSVYLKPCAVCSYSTSDKIRNQKQDYYKIDPLFFPKRETFLKFLMKFRLSETDSLFDSLFDVNRRADHINRFKLDGVTIEEEDRIKDKQLQAESRSYSMKCGHSNYYQFYIDSDECALCDKMRIGNI